MTALVKTKIMYLVNINSNNIHEYLKIEEHSDLKEQIMIVFKTNKPCSKSKQK